MGHRQDLSSRQAPPPGRPWPSRSPPAVADARQSLTRSLTAIPGSFGARCFRVLFTPLGGFLGMPGRLALPGCPSVLSCLLGLRRPDVFLRDFCRLLGVLFLTHALPLMEAMGSYLRLNPDDDEMKEAWEKVTGHPATVERCAHNGLLLVEPVDGGCAARCVLCGAVGPVRSTPETARKALLVLGRRHLG